MFRIPFNRPSVVGSELSNISAAVERGHISGDGHFTKLVESQLSQIYQSPTLLTSSCTHALEMSTKLLNLKKNDEVILPSFTFVSTANAVLMAGAKPVFADIDLQTMNIDINSVQKLVTKKTKAVIIVHYGGAGASPDVFDNFCKNNNFTLIEDNAHGFGGQYKKKLLGKFGQLSTLSFHETKNVICGEGGALTINSEHLLERAKIFRDKGTNRSKFLDGQVDKYTWVDEGSSWIMSDILAAFLYGQLEKFNEIKEVRKLIWDTYANQLKVWASKNGVEIPKYADYVEHTSHLFFLRFKTKNLRDQFIKHMKDHEIATPFHYQALHEAPFAQQFEPNNCPKSTIASEMLVRLPIYVSLSAQEQEYVITKIQEFKFL